MSNPYCTVGSRSVVGGLALIVFMVPWSLAHAGRAIEERRSADPKGLVEIVDLAGSVDVSAWDRPEVEVTGTVDHNVERVDVTSAGDRTSINVVMREGVGRGSGEAQLVVHVPAASSVSATLVSADLKLSGMQGDVKLQTVSGDVSGDVGGDLHANTVSGDVRMTARKARMIEVKTISGDIHLAGGGGEVEITTVSGTVKVELTTLTRGRFKSVSGDLSAELALAPNAQLDGQSVSGDIVFDFAAAPSAEFDIQSFSGDIENCFGPAPVKSRYGSGSRLAFKNGDAQARVHVDTKSGDVKVCAEDPHNHKTAMAPVAQMRRRPSNVFYVL
jgi:Putative adhesin